MARPEVLVLRGRSLPPSAVRRAAKILASGGLIAFPTDTVYGLGASAFSPAALRRLKAVKGRSSGKPFAFLIESGSRAGKLAILDARARALARAYWPGPLTLVLPAARAGRKLAKLGGGIGLRVPDHEALRKILAKAGVPMAASSANRAGHPECRTAGEVLAEFGSRVDLVLDGGRVRGTPSTVVDLTGPEPVVLREGRLSRRAVLKALADR